MIKCTLKIRAFALLLFACACLYLPGCSADRRLAHDVARRLKRSEVLSRHYLGLVIYDLSKRKPVFQLHADKYFTPASNTKLLTFYGALKMIGEHVPALRYVERGDSLIFWGTGDPSFLQSRLKGTAAYDLLRNTNKQLFFSDGRYSGGRYGRGWAWDDYNDDYQAELSELPVMDNLVKVTERDGEISVIPQMMQDSFRVDAMILDTVFKVVRDFDRNYFRYPAFSPRSGYVQLVPYKISTDIALRILSDTLQKDIDLVSIKLPAAARTLSGSPRDSVLKEMLLPSDNFIAEQLLLVCSDRLGDTLSTKRAIAHIQQNYLSALPDKPVWVDGSGLSRYNLVTPRDLVRLLELIYETVNDEKTLFTLLPAGGMSGTLKNAYPKTDRPFVFGKTGSLSNIYNQSGYLVTKKGRTYIFSFMNNNFAGSTLEVRKAMGELITGLHDRF